MSHEHLKAQLLEARKEIERLRERESTNTTPIVHKDMSLISVIPKWSGSDDTVTLEEFLESIGSSGRLGRWTENDQREVAVLKLTGSAKLFHQWCDELHEQGATWQLFKKAFTQRYRDVHTDKYHFTKLQTARQGKKPRTEAAVRCYECDGRGHFARECPTRLRKEKKLSDSPGRNKPVRTFEAFARAWRKARNRDFGKRVQNPHSVHAG